MGYSKYHTHTVSLLLSLLTLKLAPWGFAEWILQNTFLPPSGGSKVLTLALVILLFSLWWLLINGSCANCGGTPFYMNLPNPHFPFSAFCQHDSPGPLPHSLRLQRHLYGWQPLPLPHQRGKPLPLPHQRRQPQPQPHSREPARTVPHRRLYGRHGQQQRGPGRAQVHRSVLLNEPPLSRHPNPSRSLQFVLHCL